MCQQHVHLKALEACYGKLQKLEWLGSGNSWTELWSLEFKRANILAWYEGPNMYTVIHIEVDALPPREERYQPLFCAQGCGRSISYVDAEGGWDTCFVCAPRRG